SGDPVAGAASGSNRRLQQTQNQVDEKLSELDDRADALQAGAAQFETNAAKLKRKYWWKNCKMQRIHLPFFYNATSLNAGRIQRMKSLLTWGPSRKLLAGLGHGPQLATEAEEQKAAPAQLPHYLHPTFGVSGVPCVLLRISRGFPTLGLYAVAHL
ncbi:hypothetical protein Chor_005568, partial [Crotalus horridus]